MLDFLGIGAQKTGTTWLHAMLSRHPAIRFPAGKEVHFWDQHRHLGLDWYRAFFAGDHGGAKVGEITPAYGILDREVVEEIRRVAPDARLFYLIRNPIERAWSSAVMFLKVADMALEEASDQWFVDNFRSAASLRRGDFEQCLRVWRSVFPEEQLLVERYDHVVEDPRGLLRRIAAHIGVDPGFADTIPEEDLRRRVHEGYGAPIRPSLRPVLLELYERRIDSLAAYLGEDLSAWKAAGGAPPRPAPDAAEVARERDRVAAEHGPWTAHNVRLAPGVFTVADAPLNVEEKARRAVQVAADAVGDLAGLRVLDLGSHEGGFAVEFALHGAEVVGIEGRADNVARAELARRALGLDRVAFHVDDVRNLSRETYGTFDVVLCLGLLYHLDGRDAVDVLRRVRSVTSRLLVLDTHIALEGREWIELDGRRYHGCSFREHADATPQADRLKAGWASMDNTHSFWLTKPSLVDCLLDVGFTSVAESLAPFTYDYFDRATFERYKYPDRVWLTAFAGHARPVRSEPLANGVGRRRIPEAFGERMMPSPALGRQPVPAMDPAGPLPVEEARRRGAG